MHLIQILFGILTIQLKFSQDDYKFSINDGLTAAASADSAVEVDDTDRNQINRQLERESKHKVDSLTKYSKGKRYACHQCIESYCMGSI